MDLRLDLGSVFDGAGDDVDQGPVLAACDWATNGHLIEDCVRLGYLRPEWKTVDPTFGRGVWWSRWRPDTLTSTDGNAAKSPTGEAVDFRSLPYPSGSFDAGAYDPPYVCVGGRKTTGLPDMHDRFGLTDAPTTPADLQVLIDDGLTEMARVVRPKGFVLVKCQDYISSGKLWIGTHHTLSHGIDLGMTLVDRLEHYGPIRPQPPGRRQVHARRNLSTLFVFQV